MIATNILNILNIKYIELLERSRSIYLDSKTPNDCTNSPITNFSQQKEQAIVLDPMMYISGLEDHNIKEMLPMRSSLKSSSIYHLSCVSRVKAWSVETSANIPTPSFSSTHPVNLPQVFFYHQLKGSTLLCKISLFICVGGEIYFI